MAITVRNATALAVAHRRTVRSVAVRPAARSATRKMVIRASAEPASTPVNENLQKVQTAATEAWTWMKTRWEATEDSEKPAVVAIVIGVVIAQIAIGATIDVVDRIPVVSTILKLLGLGVTGYYIFKLTTDPVERDAVKSSVTGFLEKVTGDDK
ncbi:hypothetical protein VOLCADRAFT_106934 [Volvox carteri f. nagariensis]|uniref:Cyanobacterial aminoacyl-tRNA synthetase CAAD domain-containing protein n=1 Tax=Volvox carteri f. nagariensis TaxID=3068 RepID=D8UAP2_VOLCA|nr:uncharacterized protein VOLCADRAFT_106934 [Volvox carteri f. nagariensis]EFJ43139.1 hypothetical protein VOLCADRAFT_106934 [Volvox carteri f. nagariensis]|eukprot:XP_002955714.1 hypothetical protein VOLCADRAFT_106934 [Volvox carteri f. nagariensis]